MKVTGARIIIEYDGNESVYFSSKSISEVKERFEEVRKELSKLKVHFVRNLSTIIETYDNSSNKGRLYYISLTSE